MFDYRTTNLPILMFSYEYLVFSVIVRSQTFARLYCHLLVNMQTYIETKIKVSTGNYF